MTTPVETQYTIVDGHHIAYQVHGTGSVDVLLIDGWIGCCELDWDDPAYARLLRHDGGFSRVIRYDRRGTGISDPVPLGTFPGLDAWVRDAIGVLDAVGIEKCAVSGNGLGGLIAIRLAATYPDRVDALVLANSPARLRVAADHPFGLSDEAIDLADEAIAAGWGHGVMLDISGHDHHDEATRARAGRYERMTASPGTAVAIMRAVAEVDVRADLPAIAAPTLVLHQPNPVLDIQHGYGIAAAIAGAIFEDDPNPEDWTWRGETDDDPHGRARIAEFLTGVRHDTHSDRAFATLLYTDIVGSTDTAAALGDRRWRLLLDAHDAETKRQVKRSGGRVVNSTGDGVLAIFTSPTPALACATALRDALAKHRLDIRIGLHAAEIEERDDNVGGIGVHIAARVNALADTGQILVTSTVRDLVTGSGLTFTDHGDHALRGVPDTWHLWVLTES